MAEEKKEGGAQSVGQAALSILGIIAILVILWFANGGPERADLRGIFIAPPPPVGPGGAYGPHLGEQNPHIPGINDPR